MTSSVKSCRVAFYIFRHWVGLCLHVHHVHVHVHVHLHVHVPITILTPPFRHVSGHTISPGHWGDLYVHIHLHVHVHVHVHVTYPIAILTPPFRHGEPRWPQLTTIGRRLCSKVRASRRRSLQPRDAKRPEQPSQILLLLHQESQCLRPAASLWIQRRRCQGTEPLGGQPTPCTT